MTATPLARYATTVQDVELWATLSLQESRMRRREYRTSRWLVAAALALAGALWVVMVFFATGPAS